MIARSELAAVSKLVGEENPIAIVLLAINKNIKSVVDEITDLKVIAQLQP